jgi:Protein of unknown function (DUF2950)
MISRKQIGIVFTIMLALALPAAPQKSPSAAAPPKTFASPQEAAEALVAAADKFDASALTEIFGKDEMDVVSTGEAPRDRELAAAFVTQAKEKMTVVPDPKHSNRATVVVGADEWPFPVPLVKKSGKWFFDTNAGRQEILFRRIGDNEIRAIQISEGYVEAQHEYALERHGGVNQYAQRIVSTPGMKDGLAWKNADGTWGGPVGEEIAQVIEQGYTDKSEPFHGYFFKVLRGQGPAAPLGEMDYVIKGAMIGGFALVAAPAEYRVTGVKTFIVGSDGVVYQKDLGPNTLDLFKKMDRYNPDKTWTPVEE